MQRNQHSKATIVFSLDIQDLHGVGGGRALTEEEKLEWAKRDEADGRTFYLPEFLGSSY
jgi:hypothetical protein